VLVASLSGLTPSLLIPAAVATALSVLFWMLFDSEMEIPPVYGIGYPLGALALGYIVLRSIRRGDRRVEWKGRVYGAERRETGEERRADSGQRTSDSR
jgi:hypothetical protein